MGKLRVSQLADVAGVLRWDVHIADRFYYCALADDGVLEIRCGGRTERIPGCAVHAATYAKAMRAVYALCGSKGVREALARLSATRS